MAFLYVFIIYHTKKKTDVDNKQILLILSGNFGNALMDMNFILELAKMYPQKEGWTVNILTSKSMRKFCNIISDMSDFKFVEEVALADYANGTDYHFVKKITDYFKNKKFQLIITTLENAPLAHYAVASTHCEKSYLVIDDVKNKKGWARWYFERAYTNLIPVNMDMFEMTRLKRILQELGNQDFNTSVYHVEKVCDFTYPAKEYVTITLDSSTPQRRWETDKFAEVANWILDNTDYQICLSGTEAAKKEYDECFSLINNKSRVLNYVGNTGIREWIELIRGSSLHIGVDSGSVHVAASVGTPCICLTGVWDGHRCMPYEANKKIVGTIKPIAIYVDYAMRYECKGCKVYGGKFGSGNTECYRRCNVLDKNCMCLHEITSDNIIKHLNKIFI